MKKRIYGVEVIDRTCNDLAHESGIYGANDYRWETEPLNGGSGDYTLTKEEAEHWVNIYTQYSKDKGLDWVFFRVDYTEE